MKRVTLVAVCLLFISAIAVAADAPKAEVFGGYSYFRCDTGSSDVTCNLNGWNASVAFNAKKYLGIVANFGGSYGKIEDIVDTKIHSFLFGPQFSVRKDKVTPFAHALFGVAHVQQGITGLGTDSANEFAMALGGGLDINAGKKIAIRVAQADYVMSRKGGESFNNFSYSAGIVLKLGNR
jgi:opacity protein-like surface antigen